MKKNGLVLGKYAPLHKGHQLVIETALQEVDHVFCMIYDTTVTEIPLQVRARWLRQLYPQITVIPCWDAPLRCGLEPEVAKEQNDYILKVLGSTRITHFFSSEPYGESVAKALNAIDRRIDESRSSIRISATMIREQPYKYRTYLSLIVYSDMISRIVFMGAMSTGKSTISRELAKKYQTVFMPEYGREYWGKNQVNRRIELSAFDEIATGHIEREDKLIMDTNQYMFVDTNAITTYIFAQDYHGKAPILLENLAIKAQSRYDLHFLCEDDIPYEDTWDRSGPQKRQWFHRMIRADLDERRIPYIRLYGNLSERIAKVTEILSKFRKYRSIIDA